MILDLHTVGQFRTRQECINYATPGHGSGVAKNALPPKTEKILFLLLLLLQRRVWHRYVKLGQSGPLTDYHTLLNTRQFRCSSVALPVMIGDVNDNPPVFAKPIIRFAIVENLSIGTEVALVEATDADADEHYGQIRYSLEGHGAGDFIIDPSTGQVKVDGEIDFESQPAYNVSVLSHLSLVSKCLIPVMSAPHST